MTFAAAPEIVLAHGGNTVRLRPSLKAAVTLERLHDGFPDLFRKLSELDSTTIALVVTCASTDSGEAQAFLKGFGERPLRYGLSILQGPLLSFCATLIPVPDEEENAPKIPTAEPQAKPSTWAETFKRLYGYGTGWLGWTPAETWAATPQEITDAFTAHTAKLKAIHGSTDEDTDAPTRATSEDVAQIVEQGRDPAFDRAGLHALQGLRSVRE